MKHLLMLYRKILVNILAAGLTPIVIKASWLPNVFNAFFSQEYKYFDYRIDSLGEMLYNVYGREYIPILILSLLLVFLPLQLLKDYYRKEGKYKMLTFLKKWILLTSIVLGLILLMGTFTNIWTLPLYRNLLYILYAAGFSLVFTTFFHYLLDRYEDRVISE